MFKPSSQVEGGAFEFDGTIVSAKIAPFTYQSGQETLGLILQIRDDDSGELRKYTDNYSVGSLAHYGPTENGRGIAYVKEERKDEVAVLTKNSRAGQFFAAAVAAGLNEDRMQYEGDANDVKFLEGLRFHFAVKEIPTKDGEKSKVLLPTKLLGAAASNGSAPAAVKPADLNDQIAGAIVELIGEAGGKIAKSKLPVEVPKKMGEVGQKNKTTIVATVLKDAFLKGIAGVKFDGKELSL